MRTVLVVIAIWIAAAFLLGPLIGRVLKFGHIRPTGGPSVPEPRDEEGEAGEAGFELHEAEPQEPEPHKPEPHEPEPHDPEADGPQPDERQDPPRP